MKYNVELHKISFIEMEAEGFQNLVKKVEEQYPDHIFYGCKTIELGEKMKEEAKKLSIEELEHKINELLVLFDIQDERSFKWYLAGLLDGYNVHQDRQMKAEEKLRVKLKGIDFFKAGRKGHTIRDGDALVLLGELKDGRSTTQVIPWDAIIEVKTEPYCPVVTVSKKKRKRAIKHIVDEVIKARELKRQKEKLKISWINLDTDEVEVKEMTYDEYKKEIG